MERVDEQAVGEHADPCPEKRGRADPVRVGPADGVARCEEQRRQQQAEQRDQSEHSLLGEGAYVRAVRGDLRDDVELPWTNAERIVLALRDPECLRAEALRVVRLQMRAVLEEPERPRERDRRERDRRRGEDDREDCDGAPSAATPQCEHDEHRSEAEREVQPCGT